MWPVFLICGESALDGEVRRLLDVLFDNRLVLHEVGEDVRHPLVRQRCEGFDIRLKILDGRGFGVRHQVFDDRGGEGLVFDLVRGGLARRGGLAVEQFDFVLQPVQQEFGRDFAGSGFDEGRKVREEVALGEVGDGGHGVSPFVKRFFIFSR